MRSLVEAWRGLPNPNQWQVTPETARLLQHWRHHRFSNLRPFFCQVEAVETLIWLTEVAPHAGRRAKGILEHLTNSNNDADPELLRSALKLATGAGKTTLMAMIIAWQTVNAVRHQQSKLFRASLSVTRCGTSASSLFPDRPPRASCALSRGPRNLAVTPWTSSLDPFRRATFRAMHGRPCLS